VAAGGATGGREPAWRSSEKRNTQWAKPTPRLENSASGSETVPENVFSATSGLSDCEVQGRAIIPVIPREKRAGVMVITRAREIQSCYCKSPSMLWISSKILPASFFFSRKSLYV